jgi:hypothetical protein
VSDVWNHTIRVNDRLAERVREAESERRARLGRPTAPRLAARLALALRVMADRLDAAPADRPLRNLVRG